MNIIENFLASFEKKNTIKNYRSHLNIYFEFIGSKPDDYFNSGREYEQDFIDFAHNIRDKSPCTRAARLNAIKQFLEENDILLSRKTLKKTTMRIKNRARSLDVIPKNEELKQILSHGTAKDRALFLMCASSGMRIQEEVLQLEIDDIPSLKSIENGKQPEFPIKVYVRQEISKNDIPRICFISQECWHELIEWMKERTDYLEQAVRKSPYKKNPDDKRIFPHNYVTASKCWNRLLRKSGFDEKDKTTGWYRMHIYTLRKFFETRMSVAGVPEAMYQQLEGHEGYLNGVYKRYTEQELAETYLKGEKNLLIFETSSDERINHLDEQLKEVTQDNKELQRQLNDIRMEMLEIKLKQVQELQRKEKERKK